MKVKELIKALEVFDPGLPVCISDWSEQYLSPSEAESDKCFVVDDGTYISKKTERSIIGTFVQIGGNLGG